MHGAQFDSRSVSSSVLPSRIKSQKKNLHLGQLAGSTTGDLLDTELEELRLELLELARKVRLGLGLKLVCLDLGLYIIVSVSVGLRARYAALLTILVMLLEVVGVVESSHLTPPLGSPTHPPPASLPGWLPGLAGTRRSACTEFQAAQPSPPASSNDRPNCPRPGHPPTHPISNFRADPNPPSAELFTHHVTIFQFV